MLLQVEPEEVSGYFKDIKQFSEDCQFNYCLHQNEPNCAVKDAVDNGLLHKSRYLSYLRILNEVEDEEDAQYN